MPAEVDDARPEQRIAEAAAIALEGLAITGWASLRWRGGRWFSGLAAHGERRPVTLLVGTRDIRPQPRHRIAVCGESVSPAMHELIEDVPVTLATWAVSFEMRYSRDEFEAARILSMAAYDDLVSIEDMHELLAGQNSWTGVPKAREALTWAEENVWSPLEFDMGLRWWVERSHERPLFNRPVFDLNGRHLFTPDLIDPVAGVIGEYNGPSHREAAAYGRDLHTWGLYAEHGLEAVAMSNADLRDGRLLSLRLREAYRRAGRRARSDRTWTIEPPAGWVATHTVDLRRSLTPAQRARLLRYRTAG